MTTDKQPTVVELIGTKEFEEVYARVKDCIRFCATWENSKADLDNAIRVAYEEGVNKGVWK